MELDYKAIGIRIRRLRLEQGLTQAGLAEMSGQEPSNLSHIERGATKLGLPTLVHIANALGVTTDVLLYDSLEHADAVFRTEMGQLIEDCTHQEQQIILRTIRSLKESLRNY